MKPTSHSYFVVMMERTRGREAVVNPETTRRGVVDLIKTGELPADQISFIHHVDGLYIYDCTAEILAEAAAPFDVMATIDPDFSDTFDRPADRIAFNRDHARGLRETV